MCRWVKTQNLLLRYLGDEHPFTSDLDVHLVTAGWWFQTFFIFHYIWDSPSH